MFTLYREVRELAADDVVAAHRHWIEFVDELVDALTQPVQRQRRPLTQALGELLVEGAHGVGVLHQQGAVDDQLDLGVVEQSGGEQFGEVGEAFAQGVGDEQVG